MREFQITSHRLVDCDNNVSFVLEDGIDVYDGGAAIPKCLNCTHIELPLDEKETLDSLLFESHKNPHFPTCLYIYTRELL